VRLPAELGTLASLTSLQLSGCPLALPYSTLYKKDPLLLVALHNEALSALDLSECGLEAFPLQVCGWVEGCVGGWEGCGWLGGGVRGRGVGG
jgi:hypothetical protein